MIILLHQETWESSVNHTHRSTMTVTHTHTPSEVFVREKEWDIDRERERDGWKPHSSSTMRADSCEQQYENTCRWSKKREGVWGRRGLVNYFKMMKATEDIFSFLCHLMIDSLTFWWHCLLKYSRQGHEKYAASTALLKRSVKPGGTTWSKVV